MPTCACRGRGRCRRVRRRSPGRSHECAISRRADTVSFHSPSVTIRRLSRSTVLTHGWPVRPAVHGIRIAAVDDPWHSFAGHAPFYRLRDGVVETVSFPADPPFGMFAETRYRTHSLRLRPGDRLVLVTDGIVERNAVRVDLSAVLVETRDLHPREFVQDLTGRVVRAVGAGWMTTRPSSAWTGTAAANVYGMSPAARTPAVRPPRSEAV